MLQQDETGFVQTMIGFFTMISSPPFKAALQSKENPNHNYAERVKLYVENATQDILTLLEEGMNRFQQSKFTINPKELLAQAMLKMGGK